MFVVVDGVGVVGHIGLVQAKVDEDVAEADAGPLPVAAERLWREPPREVAERMQIIAAPIRLVRTAIPGLWRAR